jgi:hypothetical protein
MLKYNKSTSNVEILERFQSKALRMITVIRHDLQVPTVKEEIRRLIAHYITTLCKHSQPTSNSTPESTYSPKIEETPAS